MSKVFIVNMVREDISAARQWGEFRFINEKYVYPDELSEDGELPDNVRDNLHAASMEFISTDDYLLIVGDHLQVVAFAMLLGSRYQWINVLRWDRKAQGYIPSRLSRFR